MKSVAGVTPDESGDVPAAQLLDALQDTVANGIASRGFGFKRWGGFQTQGTFSLFQGMIYDYDRDQYYVTAPVSGTDNCLLYILDNTFDVTQTYTIIDGSHGNDLTIGHDGYLYMAPILDNVIFRIDPSTGVAEKITLPFIDETVCNISYDDQNQRYWIVQTIHRAGDWNAECFVTDTEFNVLKELTLALKDSEAYIPDLTAYYTQGSIVENGIFYIVTCNIQSTSKGAPCKLVGWNYNGDLISVGEYRWPSNYCEAEAVFVRGSGADREIVIAGNPGSSFNDELFIILYPEKYSYKGSTYPTITTRSYPPYYIYVDENAVECGDGSQSFPVNDLELALKISKYFSAADVVILEDIVRTSDIRLANLTCRISGYNAVTKTCGRKLTFEDSFVRMLDIESDKQVYLINSVADFEKCTFDTSAGTETVAFLAAMNSKATLYNSVFNNNTNCIRAFHGSQVHITGTCTGSGNTNFWNNSNGVAFSEVAAASLPATNEGTTGTFIFYPS